MSEDKKFRYIGGRAWVEMPLPFADETYAYRNRLHYDVQPKPKEWEDNKLIIEGVDFELKWTLFGEIFKDKKDHMDDKQVAVPIQPTMKEETQWSKEPHSAGTKEIPMKEERKFMTDSKDNTHDNRLMALKVLNKHFKDESRITHLEDYQIRIVLEAMEEYRNQPSKDNTPIDGLKAIPEVGELDSYINGLVNGKRLFISKTLQELFWKAIDAIQKSQPQTNIPIEAIELDFMVYLEDAITRYYYGIEHLYSNGSAKERVRLEDNKIALENAFNKLEKIFKTQKP